MTTVLRRFPLSIARRVVGHSLYTHETAKMASAGVIDTILRQLATADLSTKDKLEAAVTLRDHLDHYTTGPVYPQFLKKVMPVIIGILNGPPSFQSASLEQVRLHHYLPL